MLDEELRAAILALHRKDFSQRRIADELGVSRTAVKAVTDAGTWKLPEPERARSLDEHETRVVELYRACKGNLVRVREVLGEEGIEVAYSTLTSFARKLRLGEPPRRRAGKYEFAAGQEMQHDTSPHDVVLGGKVRRLQCASLVLCYSRMIFAQLYETWDRFRAKVFLAAALEYLQAVAKRCMLDNSSVIMIGGTGRHAVPAPEMAAFQKRYRFEFVAHEKGDANRSARVERPFDFIERNFYPGRTFADLADANAQFLTWCNDKNDWPRDHLGGRSPRELLKEETPFLVALPVLRPEIYQLEDRIVDLGAWVNLGLNQYSVPEALIGQDVEVRATLERVRIFQGPRLVADHPRLPKGARDFHRLPGHHPRDRGRKRRKEGRHAHFPRSREEEVLRSQGEEFVELVGRLREVRRGRAAQAIRRLHELYLAHPTEAVRRAFARANRFGVLELNRIERLVLQSLGEEGLVDFLELHAGGEIERLGQEPEAGEEVGDGPTGGEDEERNEDQGKDKEAGEAEEAEAGGQPNEGAP
jgi:predicted transcriptional regulator